MSITDPLHLEPAPPPLPLVSGVNAGPIADFETLLGAGDDLWTDDAEFESFLSALHRWRMQDRDQSRRQ